MLRPNMSRQIPSSLQPVAPGPGQSFATPPSACIVVFNLSNEPSLKYSLALVADQGTDEARWLGLGLGFGVGSCGAPHRCPGRRRGQAST